MKICRFIMTPEFPWLLLVSLVGTSHAVYEITDLQLEDCGKNDTRFRFLEMNMEPATVSLPGSLTIGGSARISHQLPDLMLLQLRVQKRVYWWWPSIPCFRSYGSCDWLVSCAGIRRQWESAMHYAILKEPPVPPGSIPTTESGASGRAEGVPRSTLSNQENITDFEEHFYGDESDNEFADCPDILRQHNVTCNGSETARSLRREIQAGDCPGLIEEVLGIPCQRCPITAGHYAMKDTMMEITSVPHIPTFIQQLLVSGRYKFQAKLVDPQNEEREFLCVRGNVSLV